MATEESKAASAARSRVFFDINIGERKAGRIVMELYNDVVPKTVGAPTSGPFYTTTGLLNED